MSEIKKSAVGAEPDRDAPSADGVQLSRLSSVLNGLENGASAMRRHALQAMRAVQSGTYSVDPAQLSRRIVVETLGSARRLAGFGRASQKQRKGSSPLPSTPSQV